MPGVEVGQEGAAVEVTPGSFLRVVVDGKRRATLRTSEPSTPRMLGPYVDPTYVDRQLNPDRIPRSDESQQVAV